MPYPTAGRAIGSAGRYSITGRPSTLYTPEGVLRRARLTGNGWLPVRPESLTRRWRGTDFPGTCARLSGKALEIRNHKNQQVQ
jgi:hypothetical protein